MKTLAATFFATLLVCPLLAQQPQGADVPLPGQEPQGQLEKPISLIPENIPSVAKPSGGDTSARNAQQLTQSKTIQSEAELKERIRLREAKTRALQDPAVQEAKANAAAMRTDPEKREALRTYYTRLYARILKIDGSLKEVADKRKQYDLARLTQPHLDAKDAAQQQTELEPSAEPRE